jgi:hypothetical protein
MGKDTHRRRPSKARTGAGDPQSGQWYAESCSARNASEPSRQMHMTTSEKFSFIGSPSR